MSEGVWGGVKRPVYPVALSDTSLYQRGERNTIYNSRLASGEAEPADRPVIPGDPNPLKGPSISPDALYTRRRRHPQTGRPDLRTNHRPALPPRDVN